MYIENDKDHDALEPAIWILEQSSIHVIMQFFRVDVIVGILHDSRICFLLSNSCINETQNPITVRTQLTTNKEQ